MNKIKEFFASDDFKVAAGVIGGFAALLLLVKAASPKTLKFYIGGKRAAGYDKKAARRTMTWGGSRGRKFV